MWTHVFSLPKSEVAAAIPPGTAAIFHEAEGNEVSASVKFPPPTADPRDPLNYSASRKAGTLVVAAVYGFVANFTSAVIAPALQLWPMVFPDDPRSYAERNYLIAVGYPFLLP